MTTCGTISKNFGERSTPDRQPGRLVPQRNDGDGSKPPMQAGGDDSASDEDNCEDGDETGNRHQGVQGSHNGHSGVLRGTRSMEKTDARLTRSHLLILIV
jgi:hypothetical protein